MTMTDRSTQRAAYQRWGQTQWWAWALAWLFVSGAGCASTPSQPPPPTVTKERPSIGVVDFQQLIKETKIGKQVNDSLSTFMKDREALVELEQKELRKLENELRRQGSVLSATARKLREEQFQRRVVEYQKKVANLNREVQEKRQELLGAFREKAQTVLAQVAQKHGLTIVLEKGQGTSTLYHHPSMDISDEVIQALDLATP